MLQNIETMKKGIPKKIPSFHNIFQQEGEKQ
jgi:hypothetical protein